MGATSAGSIQMDLEIKSDLDEDIQAEASKLADRIRKQVDGMNSDMFKNVREGLVASLDKMSEAVKSSLNHMDLEMHSFVEKMAALVKQMSGIQMPYEQAQNQTPTGTATVKGPSVRGPPISTPKMKLLKVDLSMDTETIIAQQTDLANQLDITTQIIKNQKIDLSRLEDEYAALSSKANTLSTLREQFDALAKGTDQAEAKIEALKQKMSEATSLKQKISINDQIKSLKQEINTALPKMDSLKSRITQLDKSGNAKGLSDLRNKILKLKSAISSNESKMVQMRRALSILSNSAQGAEKNTSHLTSMVNKLTNSLSKLAKKAANAGMKKLGDGFKSATKSAASFAGRLLHIGNSSNKASSGMGRAHMGLKQMIKSFTIFSLIFPLVSRGIMALGQNIGATLMTNTAFANSLNQIRSNLATAFTPIFQAIMPALNALMSALATITGYFSAFISGIFGKSYDSTKQATSGIYAAKDAMGAYGSSADKAAKATEKARRTLMGFDEINKLDDKEDSSSGGGGGGGGAPVYTPSDVNQGTVNKWVKKLKDLWSKGDYAGIGKIIGNGINTGIKKISDFISWDHVGKSVTDFVIGFTDLFNSIVRTIDWTSIGSMFGKGVNTLVNTLYLFITKIDWKNLGAGLANGIMGFVNEVDWIKMAKTLSTGIVNIFNGVREFIKTIDWAQIGMDIGDFLINIDWWGIVSGAIDLIIRAVIGLGTTIGAAFGKVAKWAWDGLCNGIVEFFSNPGEFIKNNIVDPFVNWVKDLFGIHSPSKVMADIGKYVMEGLINGIKSIPIVGSIAELVGDGIDWITGKYEDFKRGGKELFENVKNGITNNPIVKTVGGVVGKGITAISDKYNDFKTKGREVMNYLKNGVDGNESTVLSRIGTVVSNMAYKITSGAVNKAASWGSDMMSGLASGIRSASSWVSNAVSSVADTIASWLHFTRPDVGPLREYETWMPDMMRGLSDTLELSTPNFINKVKTIAESMTYAMQAALQEPTIAFAGERSLNVQHEWKESHSDKDKVTMKDLIEEVKSLKQKFDEVKEEIRNKDTDVYLDGESIKDDTVKRVNKDTRKNGKCPIDM